MAGGVFSCSTLATVLPSRDIHALHPAKRWHSGNASGSALLPASLTARLQPVVFRHKFSTGRANPNSNQGTLLLASEHGMAVGLGAMSVVPHGVLFSPDQRQRAVIH